MSVNTPQARNKGGGSEFGGLVGAAVGTYAGGNTAAGYAIGSQAGATLDKQKMAQSRNAGDGGREAIARRAEALQQPQQAPAQNYGAELDAAEQAASYLPPEQQKQYLPAIQAAKAKAQQGVA